MPLPLPGIVPTDLSARRSAPTLRGRSAVDQHRGGMADEPDLAPGTENDWVGYLLHMLENLGL